MSSNVWDQVCALVERTERLRFRTWFAPTRFISDDGKEIRVAVPNALFRDWMSERYVPIVQSALSEVGRGDGVVVYLAEKDWLRG